jgi:hypothetical protein
MSDENVVHEEEYKGYTIKIELDDDAGSPREWDNVGTMACWHSRYNLGDIQPKEDPVDFLCGLLGLDNGDYSHTRESLHILEAKMTKDFLILPLRVYEHSGITISTSNGYPYDDVWDAGQVGWIYITKKDAVKEWGKKVFTKAVADKAYNYLRGEVKTYDDYLTGNVYGYRVLDEDGELIESVWGFYPDHDDNTGYDYCLKEAKNIVDWKVEEADKQKWESLQEQEAAMVQV